MCTTLGAVGPAAGTLSPSASELEAAPTVSCRGAAVRGGSLPPSSSLSSEHFRTEYTPRSLPSDCRSLGNGDWE